MGAGKRVAVVMQPDRPYCRSVLQGVATVATQCGWDCVLVTTEAANLLQSFRVSIQALIGHLTGSVLVEQARQIKLPTVNIAPVQVPAHFPAVSTDELAVGRLGATHLLSLGLPNLAFFGTTDSHFARLREEGFAAVASASGVALHRYIHNVRPGLDSRPLVPSEPLSAWIKGLPKPVGVLASTDDRGLEILAICRNLGIAVPESVAVVAVDNDDVYCNLAIPPLSSIALATQRIGYEGARMLDRLMAGDELAERQLLIPPAGVVPRRSTDLPGILDADVAAAVRYISLHVQHGLQVADLLDEVPVSRRSLEQKFRKALGRTPAAEIRRAQVETAKQILSQTLEPMARVARASGFGSTKHLTATFLREAGMTPTAYRRREQPRQRHSAA